MTPLPFFSVVVPTRDRPSSLRRCLEAIAALTYPRDRYEVVVVDDLSRTSLEEIVASFRRRMSVRLVPGEGRGPAAARNAGGRAARGEILAFTDDDCAPRPDWLSVLAARSLAEPGAGVGGHTVNRLESNIWSSASQMLIDFLCRYYNAPGGSGRFFTTSNLALPVAGFREIGGFSIEFGRPGGEDRELCDRWVRSGRRILWEPDAAVEHAHPLSPLAYWRQHVRYGRGARLFHRARLATGGGRMTIEPPRFYRELLGYPFRVGSERAFRMTVLLALAQVANVVGYFTPIRNRRISLPTG